MVPRLQLEKKNIAAHRCDRIFAVNRCAALTACAPIHLSHALPSVRLTENGQIPWRESPEADFRFLDDNEAVVFGASGRIYRFDVVRPERIGGDRRLDVGLRRNDFRLCPIDVRQRQCGNHFDAIRYEYRTVG